MSTVHREADSTPSEAVGDRNGRESELGQRLRRIRERYIAEGGTLLTAEEIAAEVAERRGQRSSED